MVCKQKNKVTTRKMSKNEKYLNMVFTMMRKSENLTVSDKATRFNNTEIRLIGEVLAAKCEGERLISTQLATRLGVTRSAISQIVNRLEEQGVVVRVADEVDRKIAYIEVTEETLSTYSADLKCCADFIGRMVKTFGEDKFNEMYQLVDGFMTLVEEEKTVVCKKSKK
ncbi:MAG: MarR family transcriptional regulator [Clostridia bacterium]|nr:MarR family transcriptional regulator [Clostridia bacterium]